MSDFSLFLTAELAYDVSLLLKFDSFQLQKQLLSNFLISKKRICLAITESNAENDIVNIIITAEKITDEKYYVINDAKKL